MATSYYRAGGSFEIQVLVEGVDHEGLRNLLRALNDDPIRAERVTDHRQNMEVTALFKEWQERFVQRGDTLPAGESNVVPEDWAAPEEPLDDRIAEWSNDTNKALQYLAPNSFTEQYAARLQAARAAYPRVSRLPI